MLDRALTMAKIILSLTITWVVCWVAVEVRHSARQALAEAERTTAAWESLAAETGRTVAAVRALADDLRNDELGKHTKNAIISWHGISFDLRKNWTSNAAFQARTEKRMADAMDSASTAMVRAADAVAGIRADLAPPAAALLNESKIAVRQMADSASCAVGQAGDGVERVTSSAAGAIDETAAVIHAGKPIVDSGARIADSAAKVAEHYEKEWTRGSAWSKAKYIINAILQTLLIVK